MQANVEAEKMGMDPRRPKLPIPAEAELQEEEEETISLIESLPYKFISGLVSNT